MDRIIIECTDYDSMGNHGRFPKPIKKNQPMIKRQLQKLILWYTMRFKKNKRKSIWKL
jgi:hypothetical protein